MSESLTRLASAWNALGRPQQLVLAAAGIVLPIVLFLGFQWMSEGSYVPLFASLSPEDAGAIVNQLKASKTPYRIAGNGEQILVPADKAAELRLRMAVQGLPLGGGVGFEIFDKPSFGVGDFTEHLNFQRALQGELARTISQLHEVVRARVHLVLPRRSMFTDQQRPASAAVFVKLVPGGELSREEVRGIVHLVASSVEGLTADRVTVVDTEGRVLSVGADDSGSGTATSSRRLEIKTAVEEELQRRVQSLLDAAVGPGQAVTTVAADVDFDQVERTEEKYDPNPVTKQKTQSTETTKGLTSTPVSTPAVPPPVSADPNAPPPAPVVNRNTTQNDDTRQSESVTYDVSHVVARTLTSPGQIQRISVSVLINTPTKVTTTADKKELRQPAPRPPQELDEIRKVVMGAIGFNQARGDQVTVVELPFDTTLADRERVLLDAPLPPRGMGAVAVDRRTLMIAGGAVAVVVVAAVLLLLGRAHTRTAALAQVTRSLDRTAAAPSHASHASPVVAAKPAVPSVPRTPTPLVPEELLELSREREDIRQKALSMASAEPDATAQLLRAWLVKKKHLQTARGSIDGA